MGKVINKKAVLDECKKYVYSIQYLLFTADFTRNLLSQSTYIRTNGNTIIGPLRKDTASVAKALAKVLKVKPSYLVIDTSTIKLEDAEPTEDINHFFINRVTVENQCFNRKRSIRWALGEVGMSYNDYNAMSYLKINYDGTLSPVKKINEKVFDLAKLFGCSFEDLLVNVSNVNVYETN